MPDTDNSPAVANVAGTLFRRVGRRAKLLTNFPPTFSLRAPRLQQPE